MMELRELGEMSFGILELGKLGIARARVSYSGHWGQVNGLNFWGTKNVWLQAANTRGLWFAFSDKFLKIKILQL